MPGYVIHLAIGKEYLKRNKVNDESEFLRGIIMPDLLDKNSSHFGEASSNPDFSEFLKLNSLDSDYNKGYYLHLITDYLFYNKYLREFSEDIYEDYNKLNSFLVEKYGIEIPSELQGVVKFSEGEPRILRRESICGFIEAISKINLQRIKENKDFSDDDVEK